MNSPDDRIAALIAAAVAEELTPEEKVELDGFRRTHPWVDEEIANMRDLARRLALAEVAWTDVAPSDALRQRVAASTNVPSDASPGPVPIGRVAATPPDSRRSRRWLVPMLSAACLAIGLVVGLAIPPLVDAPPSGGPGTLGAIEEIDVRSEAAGAQIDAALVAHTWGTEAVVDASGLDVGATYSVVLIGSDGAEFSAGEMLGSAVPIHCRLNAAVLRAETVRLEIREVGAETPTAVADLPQT
ncbi:anti-sigma factor [Microbacterium sp. P01]|uniref:anti-sigma factor n=1 Tax=Microbacterium sp. P01 TaxID=3366261 RepID=UPI00366A6D3F